MRAVLLQVRIDSSRLPGKALLKLGELTVIEHAMKALSKIDADLFVVVTTEDSAKKLEPLISNYGFKIFTGDKNNVLKRYVDAIKYFHIDQVVRATGDNPLVSHELANLIIKNHNKNNFDYSGYLNNPVGTGVEVVNSKILLEAYEKTTSDYDKEHVTPYVYNNKQNYNVFQGDAPNEFLLPNTFVTIDTKEDYNRIVKLFHELYHGEIIPLESVIKWLKKEQSSSIPI